MFAANRTPVAALLGTALALALPSTVAAEAGSHARTSHAWKAVRSTKVAPVAKAAPKTASSTRAMNALEAQVLGGLNSVRAQHGLGAVRFSAGLTAAADAHSQQMAKVGYFAHESANGEAFWKRVRRYYKQGRFRYWSVGENLLWSSPSVDAQGAIQMWMNSPEHRENMLDKHWRDVGLSAVHVTVAPGAFRGLEVTIVTADFGVRR